MDRLSCRPGRQTCVSNLAHLPPGRAQWTCMGPAWPDRSLRAAQWHQAPLLQSPTQLPGRPRHPALEFQQDPARSRLLAAQSCRSRPHHHLQGAAGRLLAPRPARPTLLPPHASARAAATADVHTSLCKPLAAPARIGAAAASELPPPPPPPPHLPSVRLPFPLFAPPLAPPWRPACQIHNHTSTHRLPNA